MLATTITFPGPVQGGHLSHSCNLFGLSLIVKVLLTYALGWNLGSVALEGLKADLQGNSNDERPHCPTRGPTHSRTG